MRKLTIFASLMAMPLGAYANLITNGDFEAGNTGFITSYAYYAGTGDALYGAPPSSNAQGDSLMWNEGVYTITNSQAQPWHGLWRNDMDLTGHGYYMLFNGSTAQAGSTAWSQSILPPLVHGQTYRLSFDVITVFGGDPNEANLQIRIGTQLVGAVLAPTGAQQWKNVFIEFTFDSAWGSSANILNIENAAQGNDFGIDNLNMEAVPEPFTVTLGALGIAAFLRRRVKSQKPA